MKTTFAFLTLVTFAAAAFAQDPSQASPYSTTTPQYKTATQFVAQIADEEKARLGITEFAQPQSVGRFQVFSGIVDAADLAGKPTIVEHTIFRIDTATGKTWAYVLGRAKDGKILEFWSEVPEHPKRD